MAIVRVDRKVQTAQGQAISGAQFYVLTQPADVDTLTPLASVYSDLSGTPTENPQETDGLGQVVFYLQNTQLYTFVIVSPLIDTQSYPDQSLGSTASGVILTPFKGVPTGTIDGTNTVFTMVNGSTPLSAIPAQAFVWINYDVIPDLDYALSLVSGQVKITFAKPPQPASGSIPADALYSQGLQ